MPPIRERLIRRFRDKDYRHDYTESFFDTLIATQIRALRKLRKWSQKRLGDETGTTQGGISTFENTDYSSWSVGNLRRFARAFDLALVVKFESFGEVLKEIEDFNEASVVRQCFSEDSAFADGITSSSVSTDLRTVIPAPVDLPYLSI